jgi:hypothetical protein
LRHTHCGEDSIRVIRFAWLAAFLATLSLVAILALAKSAQALTVPAPDSPGTPALTLPIVAPPEEEGEEDEGAETSEECEAAEEEAEEGEVEECEERAATEAPEECILSSAEATVFALGGHDKVRLVIRYTTTSPTLVAVDYGLHGSKGSLFMGQSKERFAARGVFRETESMSEPEMAKVAGAKDFTVQLFAVHAPRYCRHFFDRDLSVRHAVPSGLTWMDPESSARRSSH